MSIVMIQASDSSNVGFQCYGAARDFWHSKLPEIILAGPYETGKTFAVLNKLHALLSKYPHSRALMVRKTYKSLVSSAVASYENKVLPVHPSYPNCPVKRYGGERPDFYIYPNGSRLILGGMDSPDKFLSAEFDFIYVNQAEEIKLDDWEKLTGRATGRAGNTPYAQVMGDCNPDVPQHWIINRDRLKVFKSRHEDNPVLYYQSTKEITAQGKKTMESLDALTGVRYKRGRLGIWCGKEGMVYEEYDEDIHLVEWFDPPHHWERYRCVDFGHTNPFVCGWWAADEDGRLYLYREIYMSKRTVAVHSDQIKRLEVGMSIGDWSQLDDKTKGEFWDSRHSEKRFIRATIADHDAEDKATLEEHGFTNVVNAKKEVSVGIEKVQERLKVQGDGRPRIFFMKDTLVETDSGLVDSSKYKPTCTVEEIPNYVYPDSKEGKSEDEHPLKLNDHGMDMTRYMVMHLEKESIMAGQVEIRGGIWGKNR